VAAVLGALKAGIHPDLPESIELLREPSRRPMGQRLLERAVTGALFDDVLAGLSGDDAKWSWVQS
jgi:hypothetical protein